MTRKQTSDPCQSKSHRWSQRHADGSRYCKDCGQIDAYGVDPDQVIGGYAGQGTAKDPARKQTSAKVSKLAAKYLAMSDDDLWSMLNSGSFATSEKLFRAIRTLAASCLSQDEVKGAKPKKVKA